MEAFLKPNIREIAAVLGQAFFKDPFYTYIMPNVTKRRAQIDWWMHCMLRYGYRYGKVAVADAPVRGAAIWLEAPHSNPEKVKMLSAGLYQGLFRLGIRGFRRMLKITHEFEKLRKQEQDPYWYLMLFGVSPEHQGKGVGSSLLQPILRNADQATLNCYLETMTQKNVSFYQSCGFEIVREERINDAGPYWTMRRTPREIGVNKPS